ncbi:pyrophosphohydrolase domain-containing protein [Nocardia sp. NPDC055321]
MCTRYCRGRTILASNHSPCRGKRITIWTDVAEFNRAFDIEMCDAPGWPADADVALALRLIEEEVAELHYALVARDMVETADGIVDVIYVTVGLGLRIGCIPIKLRRVGLLRDFRGPATWDAYDDIMGDRMPVDLEVFRECLADAAHERHLALTEAYIATLVSACLALAAALNLPLKTLWNEVHANNMSKLVDGRVLRDAGGKVPKPEGRAPPDIRSVLERHGWRVAA